MVPENVAIVQWKKMEKVGETDLRIEDRNNINKCDNP
jgi:hypothetical protein